MKSNSNSKQEIGSGQFGVVKKGVYRGREVAIKEIKTGKSSDHKLELNSIGREAHLACLASSNNHLNVVKFFGAYEDSVKQTICLVFQYMGDGSVEKVLMKEKKYTGSFSSDISTVLKMARDAACGVVELHRVGVVHRDLSTRNLLTDHQQRVRYVCSSGIDEF